MNLIDNLCTLEKEPNNKTMKINPNYKIREVFNNNLFWLFINCKLITINNGSKNPVFITAPSHDKDLSFGYLFYKCEII